MALSNATACPPRLSVVITAYNEGEELRRTIDSVRAGTQQSYEIIVVDDGSTDGSCAGIEADDVRVVRHDQRVGVAASRNDACAAARGEVFAFLDAHQRISPGCLDQCADIADARQAIVWPDVRGLEDRDWTGHGARLCLCDKHGFFAGHWVRRAPRQSLSAISMMIVPGYVMPRAVYGRVRWIGALRGWGASEPAITVKAFFLNIPILHLCGPLARHWFRQELPYATPWEGFGGIMPWWHASALTTARGSSTGCRACLGRICRRLPDASWSLPRCWRSTRRLRRRRSVRTVSSSSWSAARKSRRSFSEAVSLGRKPRP